MKIFRQDVCDKPSKRDKPGMIAVQHVRCACGVSGGGLEIASGILALGRSQKWEQGKNLDIGGCCMVRDVAWKSDEIFVITSAFDKTFCFGWAH